MKELVVISGKGGTGKTSVVAALAALAENKLLADCDVDAANLHLILTPHIRQREDFSGGKCARVTSAICTACGECWEVCRYDAVRVAEAEGEKTFRVDPLVCEGCGVCAHFCPTGAMVFEPVVNGQWFVSDTRHGTLVHARLSAGGENSGRLVTLIRQQARRIAEDQHLALMILDGSPGIGCPVIASLTGADLALVVTEPTLAGIHDFGRIVALSAHLSVPVVLCINKWDLNPELTQHLEQEAAQRQISVVGKVRYSPAFTQAQRNGISVVEYNKELAGEDLRALWQNLKPLVTEEELTLKLL
jgi:MinD superfamily P-loop ATPase